VLLFSNRRHEHGRSECPGQLPDRPNLEQLKKQASRCSTPAQSSRRGGERPAFAILPAVHTHETAAGLDAASGTRCNEPPRSVVAREARIPVVGTR
jgi:hypothetical protein